VDLNLLVVLDALLREGSVTRAASRVGLSQPALSHALARLRAQFEDPLFVRRGRGLEPTARARAMTDPVRRAIAEIERALSTAPAFDPSTSRRNFVLMMSDLSELRLMPHLSARLLRLAPGVSVRVVHGPTAPPDEVLAGDHAPDIVLSLLSPDDTRPCRAPLYRQTFVVLLRRRHAALARKLTLARYLELDHLVVAPRGRPGSLVDSWLSERGLHRRVTLTMAHFFGAALVASNTDLALSAPSALAEVASSTLPLGTALLPLTLPENDIGQFWHARDDLDPGHRWLRAELARAAQLIPARRHRT